MAWNHQRIDDPAVEVSALQWSTTAMSGTVDVLSGARVRDRPRAVAAIGEAVWAVTIVDATLMRHHPEAYDAVMASRSPAERPLIERTLAGLRFIRNQTAQGVNLAEFITLSAPEPGADSWPITNWTWNSAPAPALESIPPRAQAWEMRRYRAYQAQLADHSLGKTFSRAVAYLEMASANALTGLTAPAAER